MQAMQVYALASGSSGNAILICAEGRALLVDAGLAPRTLAGYLRQRGVGPERLGAILLTHEHDDHLRGAALLSDRYEAPVTANRATLAAADRRTELRRTQELATGSETRIGPFTVRSFAVSHDAAEPVGYVVEAGGARMMIATDLGCGSGALREAMRKSSLCVIESNHDIEWLWRGPYPPHRKARVASDVGHLSNHDALSLMAERLDEGGPAAFWLAHLSRVNNSPALAARFAEDGLKSRTRTPGVVQVALRDRPSLSWRPGGLSIQPSLFVR